jgi:urate oxidase
MNRDALMSLAKNLSLDSASCFTDYMYSELLDNDGERQILYSENDVDIVSDYYSESLSNLYSDIIQCKYSTTDEIANAVDNTLSTMTDHISKRYADISQISYSSEAFDEIQQHIYACIADDINDDLGQLFNEHTL